MQLFEIFKIFLVILFLSFGISTGSAQKIEIADGASVKSSSGAVIKISSGTEFINNSPDTDLQGLTIFSGSENNSISGTQTSSFGTLVLDQSGKLSLSQDIEISQNLDLQNGVLDLYQSNLTLSPDATITGMFDANSMIAADDAGKIIQNLNADGYYFYPLGNLSGTTAYSPFTLTLSGGTYTNASLSVDVIKQAHPNINTSSDYINRYWEIIPQGADAYTADFEAVYAPSDLTGNESGIFALNYTGSIWEQFSASSSYTLSGQTQSLFQITGADEVLNTRDDETAEQAADVFVNSEGIKVVCKKNTRLEQIRLYDALGRLLKSEHFQKTEQASINTSLPAGIYFVSLKGEGINFTRKVVMR